MRKIAYVLLFYCFFILLSGCVNDNSLMSFDSSKYVELYDYSSESIDYSYTQITDEDVEAIILMELSVNEAYIEITDKEYPETNDIVHISVNGENQYYILGSGQYSKGFDNQLQKTKTGRTLNAEILNDKNNVTLMGIYRMAEIEDMDFILNYYNLKTYSELEDFIRNRAYFEIIFNEVFDKIIEKSTVFDYPEEIRKQIETDINFNKKRILEKYDSFESFLKTNELSEDDFKNQITAEYYELMLYKAVLDKEGFVITKSDINKYVADKNISDNYNYYDIYEQIAYEKVRNILISKVNVIK